MIFDSPQYLWGAVAIGTACSVGAAVQLLKRNTSLAFQLICRGGGLALVCGALAGPFLETSKEITKVTALVDISESVEEINGDAILGAIRRLANDGIEINVLPFAGSAAPIELPLSQIASYRGLRSSWGRLNIGETNLVAALSNGAPKDQSALLLATDGYETVGDSAVWLGGRASGPARLFPLIPRGALDSSEEFRISKLHVPLVAPSQKSVDIRVAVANQSAQLQRGRLVITHEGKELSAGVVEVDPGSEKIVIVKSDPSNEGIREIRATLTPEQEGVSPTTEVAYLSGEEREKVLLLSGGAEDQRYLEQALRDRAYQLSAQTGTIPALPPLSGVSTVILNNIARQQLPVAALDQLRDYVRAGGGLVMVGGNRSFGLGGYIGSAIEEVLPVRMLPPQTEQKRLNIAVALVLDKSRSMANNSKIEFAKEAGREVIRNLKDQDYITVIGFDDVPYIVVKIGRVGDIRQFAIERMERIFANNTTNMMPAIDEARRALSRTNAGRKHMIIMTDGKIPDEGPYYGTLAKELRMTGITISTVMMGAEADPGMLKTMAQIGGGAFYQTNDPRALPRIFLKDIQVTGGERTMREELDYAVRLGAGKLSSTTISAFPTIRGYVQTAAREGANVELVAYSTERVEPLLASWKFGAGRAVAFTSDTSGRWSSNWVPWAGFGRFWGEVIDSLRGDGRGNTDRSRFDLRPHFSRGTLELDLTVYRDSEPTRVVAELKTPSNELRRVEFRRESAGHYRADVGDVKPGRYEFRGIVDGAGMTPVAFALSGELFGERRGRGFDSRRLQAFAELSGGKVNPTAADFKGGEYRSVVRKSLSSLFILGAVFFFIFEILLRVGAVRRLRGVRMQRSSVQ